MTSRTRLVALFRMGVVTGVILSSQVARAASSTWTDATSGGDWNTATNWSSNTVPANGTATFNIAVGGAGLVANAIANQSLNSITFDSNANSLTIGTTGGKLLQLSDNGFITLASTLTGSGITETINSPIVVGPGSVTTAGTYTITNLNANSTDTLVIAGGISGGTTSSTETLNLQGTNTGSNTISGAISNGATTGGLSVFKKNGGTWILTGANTYTGATTVDGGTFQVGNGSTGSLNGTTGTALSFNGGPSIFNVNEASGVSQGMGTLTFTTGEGIVQSTNNGGTSNLTFSSLAARAANATGNFILSGGTLGTAGLTTGSSGTLGTNNIMITGQAAGFLSAGLFFNGSTYAYYDPTGFVRGINYGVDANSSSVGAASTIGTVTGASNVQTTGAITAQTATTINTLNIGANNFTMASGTLQTAGLLSSGGSNVIFTGGNIEAATGGGELVVRVNNSTDQLTIGSVILNNATSSLTKSGAGTLILTATNTYAGVTKINEGALQIGNGGTTGKLSLSSAITDSGALIFDRSNAVTQGTDFDVAAFGGVGSVTQEGSGTVTLNAANTYSGGTTVSAGTLSVNNTTGSGTGTGAVAVNSGGTLSGTGTIAPTITSGYGVTVTTGGTITPGGVQPAPVFTPNPTNPANGNLTLNPTGITGGNLLSVGTSSNVIPSLNFALGSGNSSSQIVVAGTSANVINFNVGGTSGPGGTSSVLSINDLVGGSLTLNQEYVLIAGNGVTTYEDNGLTLAAAGDLGAVTAEGQQIIGGLSLLEANTPGNFFSNWYGSSELFLVGDNIDIEVIPEPGTWAMMLGGWIVLLFWQRRRHIKG